MLLSNEPGVDPRPFLCQAAATQLAGGGDVVYLVTDRRPAQVRKVLERAGADLRNLTILDAHSLLTGVPSPDDVAIDPVNIADIIMHIEHAAAEHSRALFLLESLNGLITHGGATKLAAAGPRLVRSLKRFPASIVAFTQWHEELGVRPLLESFPHHLHLSAVQQRIITSQYFRINKLGGQPAEGSPTLYRSLEGGLVQVYVPKVVVTGPADAGKSTFVHAVSDHAVSAERMGATVALDRGTLNRQGLHVDIFGTPGQERFDPLLDPILHNAVGVILMVDATQPASFERASYMLRRSWRRGIHVIIAANKQDLEGALTAAEVARRLDAPPGTEVLPCSATDGASATRILDLLLDSILSQKVTA